MQFEDRSPETEAVPSLHGATVVDVELERVGKVTDVLFDDRAFEPRWAVVRTGVFGGEHYVPLERSYVDEEGRLVVPFGKASIRRAPRARGDHLLTPELVEELHDHYGRAA
jgi:hypothetical protein